MPTSHHENFDINCFRCRIFVAALLREVARRSRDRGSFSLIRLYSLSQLRWQLPHWRSPLSLSPTASRCGSVTLRLWTSTGRSFTTVAPLRYPQGEALKNFFCILKFTVSIVPTNTQSEVVIKLFTVHFADWELYLCTAPIEKCAVGDFSQP